jgi:HSP20 family protein
MNNLRTYQPYGLINQLNSEINRLFGTGLSRADDEDTAAVTADWIPAVDIREEEQRYVLRADVPGVDPDDIEITMENGVLTVRGERNDGTREEGNGYRRVERFSGRFFRRFTLPDTADSENISATGRNGVLEVIIPKHARVQPRRIQVNA